MSGGDLQSRLPTVVSLSVVAIVVIPLLTASLDWFTGQRQRVRDGSEPPEDPLLCQPLHQRPHLLQLVAEAAEGRVPPARVRPLAARPPGGAGDTAAPAAGAPPAPAPPPERPVPSAAGPEHPVQVEGKPDSHPLSAVL